MFWTLVFDVHVGREDWAADALPHPAVPAGS